MTINKAAKEEDSAKSPERINVALIRNVLESRSFSMPLYADSLRNALVPICEPKDVVLEPDFAYKLAGMATLSVQDYVGRFWSFPRQLRSLEADVFHIVDHANAHLLRALDPSRTVVTCHDLMLLKSYAGEIPWSGPRPWIADRAFRWSVDHLTQAGAVLCDSESTKRDVVRLIGCAPERLHTVYLGFHEAFRRMLDAGAIAEARARFQLIWPIIILHVGKHSFYKNLEGIIEAMALLTGSLKTEAHLVKVGQDFTPQQRELIRRRGLGNRVHFFGQTDVRELVTLYNISDILLFPSLYEGFGWPPLEAMACGTPVVCSDRGSLKEVVGDAAFIVDPEDPKEIADGVERVLMDRVLRQTLVNRGFEQAKRFNWTTATEKVFKIYHEIAGARAN